MFVVMFCIKFWLVGGGGCFKIEILGCFYNIEWILFKFWVIYKILNNLKKNCVINILGLRIDMSIVDGRLGCIVCCV